EGNDLYDDEKFEAFLMDPSRTSFDLAQNSFRRRSFTFNALRLAHPLIKSFRPARGSYAYFGHLSLPGREGHKVEFLDAAAANPWSEREAEWWKRSRQVLKKGTDLCREQGIHLLLCYIPMQFPVYRPFVTFPPDSPCRDWKVWPLAQEFAQFCE